MIHLIVATVLLLSRAQLDYLPPVYKYLLFHVANDILLLLGSDLKVADFFN